MGFFLGPTVKISDTMSSKHSKMSRHETHGLPREQRYQEKEVLAPPNALATFWNALLKRLLTRNETIQPSSENETDIKHQNRDIREERKKRRRQLERRLSGRR